VSAPLKLKKTSQRNLEDNGRVGATMEAEVLLVVEFDWTEK
jgi:hypothetical protein